MNKISSPTTLHFIQLRAETVQEMRVEILLKFLTNFSPVVTIKE